MNVLKIVLASLVETALIIGSLLIFDEESIAFCVVFVFLILFISLMGYYIIKEKKPIWILILLVLLLPISYFANMGIVKIQDNRYNKQMDALVEDNQVKAKEMSDALKTMLENNDTKALKEAYTEESLDILFDKIDLKKIKFDKFGEDLSVEPYDTESWGAFGTGSFKYEGTKYYIEYSITGTKDEANYSDVTILPYDLYEKASNLTEESDIEESNKIYDEIDNTQIYLESLFNVENGEMDIESMMDLE